MQNSGPYTQGVGILFHKEFEKEYLKTNSHEQLYPQLPPERPHSDLVEQNVVLIRDPFFTRMVVTPAFLRASISLGESPTKKL